MESGLYLNLPEKFVSNSTLAANSKTYIEKLLKSELPPNDLKNFTANLKYQFLLDKHPYYGKKNKTIRKKKTFLTRKERKQLGLLKLPTTNWDYASLEPMRLNWKQYMRENLNLAQISKIPTYEDQSWQNFSFILAKSELIGAELEVVRSKNPSIVNLSGTIVLETKQTFQIVTKKSKLKIISKDCCVFQFVLDKMRLIVFGKNLLRKPEERSVKKLKNQTIPDL